MLVAAHGEGRRRSKATGDGKQQPQAVAGCGCLALVELLLASPLLKRRLLGARKRWSRGLSRLTLTESTSKRPQSIAKHSRTGINQYESQQDDPKSNQAEQNDRISIQNAANIRYIVYSIQHILIPIYSISVFSYSL